jgi:hypothetical protein
MTVIFPSSWRSPVAVVRLFSRQICPAHSSTATRMFAAAEIPLSNRTPWDEADSQFLTSCEYAVLFRVSLHHRIFGLNRRHRLNRMRSVDGSCTRFRETKVQNFAFFDQIFDRGSYVFDWYLRIDPVLVVEIDVVGSQALNESTFLMCFG